MLFASRQESKAKNISKGVAHQSKGRCGQVWPEGRNADSERSVGVSLIFRVSGNSFRPTPVGLKGISQVQAR